MLGVFNYCLHYLGQEISHRAWNGMVLSLMPALQGSELRPSSLCTSQPVLIQGFCFVLFCCFWKPWNSKPVFSLSMVVAFCPLVAAGGQLIYWPKAPSKSMEGCVVDSTLSKLLTKLQITGKIQVSRCTLVMWDNGRDGRRVNFTSAHHHAWNTLYV